MPLLTHVVLVAAAATGLSLELSSPQATVLVGEPVKLVVRWKADRDLKRVCVETEDFTFRSLRFVVEGGPGRPTEYIEEAHAIDERIVVPGGLTKGAEVLTNLVLLRGNRATSGQGPFLFPMRGRYSVKAVYVDPEQAGWTVSSNTVTFTVAEPTGENEQVFDEVRRDPAILSVNGDAKSQARARMLMETFPGSPYLRWAKLQLFKQRANALNNRFDPNTGESLASLKGEELSRVRAERHRRMAADVLAAPDWGAFEEEALAMAMGFAEAGGDAHRAASVRKSLFEKYPNSVTVREIKETEATEADDGMDDEGDDGEVIRPATKPTPKPKQ